MSSIDRVGLSGVDATGLGAGEPRPLPLVIALPLIGSLSVALWFGLARLVELVVMR